MQTNKNLNRITTTTLPGTTPKKNLKHLPTSITESKKTQTNLADLCGNDDLDLIATIRQTATSLTGTPYSQENKTDCSGMFHKMLDSFRGACPRAQLPTIDNARSSRGIAQWYHANGDLKIIRDPLASGHLIEPGAVMLYGYGSRMSKYNRQTLTVDTLVKPGIGINHVAIVTKVEADSNNVVQSYDLFHGMRPGKPAGVTTSYRVNANHPDLPTYGNWKEPWLAVAPVLAQKKLAGQ